VLLFGRDTSFYDETIGSGLNALPNSPLSSPVEILATVFPYTCTAASSLPKIIRVCATERRWPSARMRFLVRPRIIITSDLFMTFNRLETIRGEKHIYIYITIYCSGRTGIRPTVVGIIAASKGQISFTGCFFFFGIRISLSNMYTRFSI